MFSSENMKIDLKRNITISKYDTWLFYIVVIDILFLPYVRILNSSISMLILPFWFIFKMNKIPITKEIKLFFIMIFFALLSLIFSSLKYPQYIPINITYFIILLYGFLYYFFFEWNLRRNHISLQKILIIYLIFVFLLTVVYFANPSGYFYLRSFWTMSGNIIEIESSLLIHRFTSTFSDPNNLAIIINAIILFLTTNTKLTCFQSMTVIVISAFILFMTMSKTGFILFGLFLIVLFFLILKKGLSLFLSPRIKRSSLFSMLFLLILLPFIYLGINNFLNSEVAQLALFRFRSNSISSRTIRWETLLKSKNIFYSFFLGDGGTVIVDGAPYKPHNGHLHLIYNYGFIAYFLFMYIFFRIRKPFSSYKNALFLLPLFLGFTVNVGIYEPRFINIMALLVASYSASTIKLLKVKGDDMIKIKR